MNVDSFLPTNDNREDKKKITVLVEKWQKTGLLEGLEKDYERSSMSVILESQAKQLVTEANQTGTSSNAEEWSGVALPLVRRIFAEIAAKDFVSVQPMSMPSGLVFYLDFKYGTAQEGPFGFRTGDGRTSQRDSVFGVTDATRGVSAPSEGLYGAGRFGYSINDVTSSRLTSASAVSATAFTSVATTTAADYNYNTEFSASMVSNSSFANGDIIKVTINTSSLAGFDPLGVRGFAISGSTMATFFPEFTKLNASVGTIQFLVSGSTAAAFDSASIYYHKQPTSTTRGDFEDGATQNSSTMGANLDIPEISLELRSEAIVAKTRKLKAAWTPEFAQDLNAYHSIDAEAELTSMLSEQISHEIDLEILDMLAENAQTTDYWSANGNSFWNGSGFTAKAAGAGGYYNSQGEWFQTLGTKIQKVSNKIHQLTLRGGANFLVVSPTVATILESIPGYAADTNGDKMQFAMGVQKVGMINSRFQVYKNPYMTENMILMGYRGSQFLETGAVYAPYIPLIMTPLIYDPTNFTPRKGVMTRYAKKVVRPEFYGKIYVEGLETI